MKIFIKAKPGSKKEGVEKISENVFLVRVKEPPIEGRANKAIIEKLSKYFKIPKSKIELVSGQNSKEKAVEINI